MTASVGDELRAAIRAGPDDRALRLVYADWLMERGDLRGEWTALSCGQATEDTEREMRRRALWQHYGKQWKSEDWADSSLKDITYRDGFPYEAFFPRDNQCSLSPLQLHPLHTLHLPTCHGLPAAFTKSPVLEPVRCLSLSSPQLMDEDVLASLLNAPAQLEELKLWSGSRMHRTAIAGFRGIATLKRLTLGHALGLDDARWLARSCPALEELHCLGGISGEALRSLAETAMFRLRSLYLELVGNEESPGDATLAEALESPLTGELTSLGLDRPQFGAQTVAAIARLPCATTLRELYIRTVGHASTGGALEDARFPALEQLRVRAAVTDDFINVVARFPTLSALEFDGAELTRAGTERIMSSLPCLQRLSIENSLLADESVQAIAWSARARSLRHLSFEKTRVGADAVESIVASGHLNELRALTLKYYHYDVTSIRSLVDAPFDHMAWLNLPIPPQVETTPSFKEAWVHVEPRVGIYERKLELSGRAVPRTWR